MEPFIYLLKSAVILTLFYFVYLIVLQKDTFFTSNRHYLIGGIITSLLLPLVIFTKTIYVDAPVISSLQNNNLITGNSYEVIQQVSFNWGKLLITLYFIGILFMSFRFIFQLFSLNKIIQKYTATKKDGYHYIKVNEDISPFSFFKYIVYNPEKHSETELEMILKHEQSHASQLHSVDIILSNILLIVQWMNPFAWLYKKSIEENLEFIADSETIQRIPSKTQYQLTLLKAVSSTATQPILANNFYQSLIKKRIIMLHKNQSASKNQWKLLLILPFLGLFLWSFNVEEVVKYNDFAVPETPEIITTEIPSEEISIPVISKTVEPIAKNDVVVSSKIEKHIDSKITISVNKNTTDAELENLKKLFNDNYGVSLKFSGVKRNSAGEITAIKVKMKSKNSSSSYHINEDGSISEFTISYDKDIDSISIGSSNKHNSHGGPKASSIYTYDIINDDNGKVSTWVSSDAPHGEKGKNSHVIHTNGDNNHEIHVITENGNKSTVWVTKDRKVSKNVNHSITVDIDEDHTGNEENIFIIRSGDNDGDTLFIETDDDSDSIFVKSDGKSGIFISDDNKGISLLYYLNGKKVDDETMKNLDPKSITEVNVIKGDEAVEKYGKEAKDGVILITTKNK